MMRLFSIPAQVFADCFPNLFYSDTSLSIIHLKVRFFFDTCLGWPITLARKDPVLITCCIDWRANAGWFKHHFHSSILTSQVFELRQNNDGYKAPVAAVQASFLVHCLQMAWLGSARPGFTFTLKFRRNFTPFVTIQKKINSVQKFSFCLNLKT